jgi:hypothetical protein
MDTKQIAISFAIRLGLAAAVLWAVYHYIGLITMVIATPIAGVLLAKPILNAGGNWFHWARKQPYAEWNGRYYEFAGTQIRVFEIGQELWVADADLLRVIGEKPTLMLGSIYGSQEYRPTPESGLHAFSPAGALKVLSASSHYESKRMMLWLQREVYKPHQRKLDIAAGR